VLMSNGVTTFPGGGELGAAVAAGLRDGQSVRQAEDMRESLLISSDPKQHAAWLKGCIDLGFEELHLHQVGRNQHTFIDAFGGKVLPQLRLSAEGGAGPPNP
jgi:hypothetical protein